MNNNRILLLLIIALQGICFVSIAQTTKDITPCNEGNCKPFQLKHSVHTDSNPCAIGKCKVFFSFDPNEIVGLDGYDVVGSADTFRWVSATQSLAYTVYFENDAELAMAAASKIPLAHCVRGGMVRCADGRVGKRRAASENVPLPVTSSSPPFFFPFCLQVRNTIPRNVTTLSGISSVWQQTSKKCSLT
ncbi:MAG: hypothetical protein K5882_06410 [Bacteroidales bacterium]|nr:hypothetical protein [Bacteroidales bacterium]